MFAFRIADRRHPIFDGTGAMLHGARWNSPGKPVIYAAETYAGALLETLVHANLGSVPSNPRRHVASTSPTTSPAIDSVRHPTFPHGTRSKISPLRRAFGDRWVQAVPHRHPPRTQASCSRAAKRTSSSTPNGTWTSAPHRSHCSRTGPLGPAPVRAQSLNSPHPTDSCPPPPHMTARTIPTTTFAVVTACPTCRCVCSAQ